LVPGIGGGHAAPLSGVHDLACAIYDEATGGTALWSEVHTNVPVIAGQVNVFLGSLGYSVLLRFQRRASCDHSAGWRARAQCHGDAARERGLDESAPEERRRELHHLQAVGASVRLGATYPPASDEARYVTGGVLPLDRDARSAAVNGRPVSAGARSAATGEPSRRASP
jgi:hypothetical protein